MSETVTALMVKPGQHPVITQLCDDSNYLDLAVSIDDDFMMRSASVLALKKNIIVIHAYQGNSLDLGCNRRVGKRILCGTFYIVGLKDGQLRSLTKDEITKYTSKFWEPELFTDDEVINSWFDGPFLAF